MARRLHGLSFFVVLVVTMATTAMPDDGAEEGNCPTTTSPDRDALLQASSVLQASAAVVKVQSADQVPITTISNHQRCTPLYPTLEVWAGSIGDMCRSIESIPWGHSCPEGCTPMSSGSVKPVCLNQGTRNMCRYQRDGQTIIGGNDCSQRSVLTTLRCFDSGEDGCMDHWDDAIDTGNYCMRYESDGKTWVTTNWIAPQGCHAISSSPWTVMPDTTTPCRVMEGTPTGPRATWRLIASGTHGVTASMEVGMTSLESDKVETATTLTFGQDVKAGAGLDIPGVGEISASVTVSTAVTGMISNAIESVIEQSEVRTVEVECPDYFDSPTDMRHPANSKIEYIWQFVVSAGDIMAKTDHFRCHQSVNGSNMPQCLPELCGDPKDNPFCQKNGCRPVVPPVPP